MAGSAKILVVTGDLDTGGTERHLVAVLPRLERTRFRISVHALTHRGELAEEMEKAGIPVWAPSFSPPWHARARSRKAGFILRSAAVLYRRLRRERPDIVHFYLPAAYLIGGPCALAAGCRRLVMSRRSLNHYQKRRPLVARVERLLHRRMSGFTANSQAVVRDLVSEGASERRISLIYNGVEPIDSGMHGEARAVRAGLGIGADTVVASIVANLIAYKGHMDLIAAMGRVDEKVKDWALLCIGEDRGLGGVLEQHCKEHGIAGKVRFLGKRNDVARLLAASDIGVLASHEEGFSNSLLEGMAAGLPMVATAVGGNVEAIVDGECGLLVPPADPGALAAALSRLMRSPNEREKLGRAARSRAASLFSMAACVRSYESFYDKVMAGLGSRGNGLD